MLLKSRSLRTWPSLRQNSCGNDIQPGMATALSSRSRRARRVVAVVVQVDDVDVLVAVLELVRPWDSLRGRRSINGTSMSFRMLG